MVLASTVRFPYEVFPLWLGVVLVGGWALRGRKGPRADLYAGLALVVASLLLLAYDLGLLAALAEHPTSPSAVAASAASSARAAYGAYLRLSGPSWMLGTYHVPPPLYRSWPPRPLTLPGYWVSPPDGCPLPHPRPWAPPVIEEVGASPPPRHTPGAPEPLPGLPLPMGLPPPVRLHPHGAPLARHRRGCRPALKGEAGHGGSAFPRGPGCLG